jgi:hypothetical protein
MTKQRQRSIQNHPDLFVVLSPISAGKTFLTGSVKNSLENVDLKIVLAEEVPFDFIQKIAVHMDEGAANFAFKMEMIPAVCFAVYVLITGAFAVVQDILADLSLGRQFFKMPVDGSLPDALFHIIKMTYNLIDCHMGALKGLHVIKNTLSLPGVIIYRTFYHRPYGITRGSVLSI